MSQLAWLLIPSVATAAAVGWAAWRGRPSGPADTLDTTSAHARFLAALRRQEACLRDGGPARTERP